MSDLNQYDLFNNPMIQKARESMTPEQLREYERQAEYMYSHVNFETGELLQDPLADFVADIVEQLKSGLGVEYLDSDEQLAMENHYGKNWRDRFT